MAMRRSARSEPLTFTYRRDQRAHLGADRRQEPLARTREHAEVDELAFRMRAERWNPTERRSLVDQQDVGSADEDVDDARDDLRARDWVVGPSLLGWHHRVATLQREARRRSVERPELARRLGRRIDGTHRPAALGDGQRRHVRQAKLARVDARRRVDRLRQPSPHDRAAIVDDLLEDEAVTVDALVDGGAGNDVAVEERRAEAVHLTDPTRDATYLATSVADDEVGAHIPRRRRGRRSQHRLVPALVARTEVGEVCDSQRDDPIAVSRLEPTAERPVDGEPDGFDPNVAVVLLLDSVRDRVRIDRLADVDGRRRVDAHRPTPTDRRRTAVATTPGEDHQQQGSSGHT